MVQLTKDIQKPKKVSMYVAYISHLKIQFTLSITTNDQSDFSLCALQQHSFDIELNNHGKGLFWMVVSVLIRWEDQHLMVNQELVLYTYSTVSRNSLLKSRRVYQITVQ